MAGRTGLAPARISAVTGRHLDCFGLRPKMVVGEGVAPPCLASGNRFTAGLLHYLDTLPYPDPGTAALAPLLPLCRVGAFLRYFGLGNRFQLFQLLGALAQECRRRRHLVMGNTCPPSFLDLRGILVGVFAPALNELLNVCPHGKQNENGTEYGCRPRQSWFWRPACTSWCPPYEQRAGVGPPK